MIMEKIIIKDDFIKLGQALKLTGAVESGVDAKFVILDGSVKVNGNTCYERGKKLKNNDVISYADNDYIIISEN